MKSKAHFQKYICTKILSIDPSSNKLAFAVVSKDKLEAKGKVDFPKGASHQERIKTLDRALPLLLDYHQPDLLLSEGAIYIQNPQTTITLAYLIGAIMGHGAARNLSTALVDPLEWKPGLGYKNISRIEKAGWVKETGKKEAEKKARFERKERIRLIVMDMIPDLEETDNDIIDAIGIGLWGMKTYG